MTVLNYKKLFFMAVIKQLVAFHTEGCANILPYVFHSFYFSIGNLFLIFD